MGTVLSLVLYFIDYLTQNEDKVQLSFDKPRLHRQIANPNQKCTVCKKLTGNDCGYCHGSKECEAPLTYCNGSSKIHKQ